MKKYIGSLLIAVALLTGLPFTAVVSGQFVNPGSFFISGGGLARGPVLFQNGTAAAPSITFASDTDTGFYRSGANTVRFVANGADATQLTENSLDLIRDAHSLRFGSSSDVVLSRDAANTLAQRNGTNAQTFNLYTPGLAAVSTAVGLNIINNTLATAGVPVQQSGRFNFRTNVWNTTATAANNTNDWWIESVPVSGTTPLGLLKFGSSLNGAAATYPMTLTSSGALTTLDLIVSGGALYATQGNAFGSTNRIKFASPADAQVNITNNALSVGFGFDVTADAIAKFRTRAQTGYATVDALGYRVNGVVGAGNTIAAVVGYGDVAAATNVGTASIATYTVGAADGTFEVSANCLVTTSTTFTFSLDVTYTDESNVARTLILPVAQLAGTFLTGGLITSATGGAGPYETTTMTIRAKAATAITVRTSAGGTFTAVVYNARGVIKQVG